MVVGNIANIRRYESSKQSLRGHDDASKKTENSEDTSSSSLREK